MKGFHSKYSDSNLFFDGTKNVYNPRDYIKDRRNRKAAAHCDENRTEEKKQFLSEEDKEIAFLIRNRDLTNPDIKKVDSENGYIGKFVN